MFLHVHKFVVILTFCFRQQLTLSIYADSLIYLVHILNFALSLFGNLETHTFQIRGNIQDAEKMISISKQCHT